MLGNGYGYFEPAGGECVRDYFSVLWDRSEDKDIGRGPGALLPEPDLRSYTFPDPLDARFSPTSNRASGSRATRFRVFNLGFSLFERAWTLRAWRSC